MLVHWKMSSSRCIPPPEKRQPYAGFSSPPVRQWPVAPERPPCNRSLHRRWSASAWAQNGDARGFAMGGKILTRFYPWWCGEIFQSSPVLPWFFHVVSMFFPCFFPMFFSNVCMGSSSVNVPYGDPFFNTVPTVPSRWETWGKQLKIQFFLAIKSIATTCSTHRISMEFQPFPTNDFA